jgi:hypothetical protein
LKYIGELLLTGKSVARFIGPRVQPLLKKDSDFPKWQISLCNRRPDPSGGALRNVTNAGQDAVDADGALRRERLKRTEKSCGPDAPTLASSSGEASFSGVTVTKKPGRRGEREGSR